VTSAFLDYLHRPQKLAARLVDADEDVQRMWAVCTKMSTSFGDVGGGGSGGDAKDGPLAAYAQLAKDIEDRRRELEETENEMLDFLSFVEAFGEEYGKRDAEILRYRYVLRRDWDFIHEEMLRRGFRCKSLRTVFNWHKGAVQRAEKLWEAKYERTEQAGA
jgi:hypothetical protein